MAKRTKTRKSKRFSKKTRRANRKHRGGAEQQVFETTLKEVRERLSQPYVTSIGLYQVNGRGQYHDKFIIGEYKNKLENIIKEHSITNDNLRQWLKDETKEKGKYYFTYL